MSNELIVQESKKVSFTQEQIDVVKAQIAVGANDLELKSFIWQCERTGLDPFSRQIYFIKSNGKVQIQTSIDGFRLIAERSGKYEGQTQAQWCGEDGVWKDIWISKDFPIAARIGVYKKGFREPLYAVAHWDEYFAQPGFMHKKMPALMIAKVAESLALRKAFPNEMSGLYTDEELPIKNPHAPSNMQPPDDENVPDPLTTKKRCDFGQFNKMTYEQICAQNPIPVIEKYMDKLEEYIKSGKYSDKHHKFKDFIIDMTEFLTDIDRPISSEPSEFDFDGPKK